MQHLKARVSGSRVSAASHTSPGEEVPVLVERQLSIYSNRAIGESHSLVDRELPVEFALEGMLKRAIYTESRRITPYKPSPGLDNLELALGEIRACSNVGLEGMPIQQSDIECGDSGGGESLIPELSKAESESRAVGARPMGEPELDIDGILLSCTGAECRPCDDAGDFNGGNGDLVAPNDGGREDVGWLLFGVRDWDPTLVRDNREESDPRVALPFVETGVGGRNFPSLGTGDSG